MVSAISGRNGDMSAATISRMQERMFKMMDANSDGKVDKDEMTSFQASGSQNGPPQGAPSIDEIFSQSDTDGDGALTKLEIEAGLSKLGREMREKGFQSESTTDKSDEIFSQMDTDGDGKVTQEEMTQFQTQGPQGGPPPSGPPPVGPPSEEGASLEDIFSQLDSDQDGSISESEFTSGLESMMAEHSSSATDTAATSGDVYDFSQLLSRATNSYLNGYSSSSSTEGQSGNPWSSYA
ncbi:MAG: EF-hand domain-containing protein [Syntrophobacteraceae bacterium]